MLSVGSVIYVYNDLIYPAKQKYMVCVVVSDGLFLCINTEERKYYNCLKILKKDNKYLEYDSHIACNRTFKFETQTIKKAQFVGNLGYADLKELKNHIKNNVKSIAISEKNKIIKSLEEVLSEYS